MCQAGGTEGEPPTGKIEIEFWIGVEDLLARKDIGLFEVSGQDHTGELNSVRSEASLVISDFGEPVNIQEPWPLSPPASSRKEQTLWNYGKQSNPVSTT